MIKEKYDELKKLEDRILQLTVLKNYLENFFACKPFQIQVTFKILNNEVFTPIPYINGRFETEKHYLTETDDGKIIIEAIDKRISELEKEFQNF